MYMRIRMTAVALLIGLTAALGGCGRPPAPAAGAASTGTSVSCAQSAALTTIGQEPSGKPTIAAPVSYTHLMIFSGDMYGWANGFLMNLGLINEPVQWLSDPGTNLTIIMIVQLWMSMGAGFLTFIAGLQGVNRSLYEAAAIDGIRNRWQEFIYVTIPTMGPQLLFGAVMQKMCIRDSLQAGGERVASLL